MRGFGYHCYGYFGIGGAIVAQLTRAVTSPALCSTAAVDGTGVIEKTSSNSRNAAGESTHRYGYVGIGVAVVAQLTIAVPSPALCSTTAVDGTGVSITSRNSLHATGETLYGYGYFGIGVAVVAQLTIHVRSPTRYGTTAIKGAAMGAARYHHRCNSGLCKRGIVCHAPKHEATKKPAY